MTVKVKSVVLLPLPSDLVTSLMLIRGSLSRMVPIPWPSAMVAFVAALRLTAKVSFGSARRSPMTATVNVRLVWPAGMVTVAGRGRVVAAGRRRCRPPCRSGPSRPRVEAFERVTVKVALTVPVLPSVTVASLTETRRRHEWPELVVDQDGDAVRIGIGRGDIEPAVAIEVAGPPPQEGEGRCPERWTRRSSHARCRIHSCCRHRFYARRRNRRRPLCRRR